MKAMILAAGFGTRLRPLTAERPKALIPIVNRPTIGRTIDYLKQHGVDRSDSGKYAPSLSANIKLSGRRNALWHGD
ncbi:MAG: NTP transferase domain-containing protein [Deltaproteobacteria bacterium]|nr:NTP transferase domain-containing protein [Deltaproteobacteria bacterium]